MIRRDDVNHPFFNAKVLEAENKNKRKVAQQTAGPQTKNCWLICNRSEGLTWKRFNRSQR